MMEKINFDLTIVFLVKSMDVGGAEKVVYNLVNYFSKHYKIILISRPGKYSELLITENNIEFWDRSQLGFWSLVSKLRTKSKNSKLILHTHNRKDIVYSKFLKKVKHFHTFHSAYPDKNWMYRLLIPSNSISISQTVENYLKKYNMNSTVIYNGVESYIKVKKVENSNCNKFLYIGRLSYEKGVLDLLQLFSKEQSYSLTLVGDGDMYPQCSKVAESNPNLKLMGYKNNPWKGSEYYDAIIIPSLWEGFCLVGVEAILNGIPVIASDIPALREILYFLPDECFFSSKNQEGMEKSIEYLQKNYTYLIETIRSKQKEFFEKFSVQNMCVSYQKEYLSK